MRGRFLSPALLLAAIIACSDQPQPTAESDASAPLAAPAAPPSGHMLSASERSDEVRLEALTQRIARALANPGFRAYVKAELDASGYAEHKVHFQRFLRANGGRALKEIAEAGNERESDVAADADAAIPLEMYLPVPAHRASWGGGDPVLVATAIADHEAPIAFDVRGHRQVLDPRVPPAVPVIAVVPAETNFNQPPGRVTCADCTGGDATPPSGGTITPSVSSVPGLYLTYAGFVQDF
ncbi:MAG: hypothetical protein H0U85_08365, partial [Gemmatimonadales bacterium]|nr:hypothetical protein [Gemmatimonadales bacterium]